MPNSHAAQNAATAAAVSEAKTPSIPSDLPAALVAFLPEANSVSQRALALASLVARAVIEEEHEGIRQKYTGLERALDAVQAKQLKAAGFINSLRDAERASASHIASLIAEVERVEGLTELQYQAELTAQQGS